MTSGGWAAVAGVMRELAGDDSVARDVVTAVRGEVPQIGALEFADVVEHVAVFVTAGLESVAARRAPTEAELNFVADLAATRAGQGVSITAMLAGLYAGQRVVWARATERFAGRGVAVETVGEVLAAHLAWVHAVQEQAISAHRRAELDAARRERDVRTEFLRAVLSGPVHAHHAAEAGAFGLRSLDRLWLVRAAPAEGGRWPAGVVVPEPSLGARIGHDLVAIAEQRPLARGPLAAPVVVTGPVGLSALPASAELAERALRAAQRRGRPGLHTPADVAVEIALGQEPELALALARGCFRTLDAGDPYARSLVHSLLVHLDCGERLESTAAALFVHPNTVRYRLQRLGELCGLSRPRDMEARVALWWAARAWLAAAGDAPAPSGNGVKRLRA